VSATLHDLPWAPPAAPAGGDGGWGLLRPLVRRPGRAAMGSRVQVPDAADVHLVGPHRLLSVLVHRLVAQRTTPGTAEPSTTRPVLAVLVIGPLLLTAVSLAPETPTRGTAAQWCGAPELGGSCLLLRVQRGDRGSTRPADASATVEHQQVPTLVGMTIEPGAGRGQRSPSGACPARPGVTARDEHRLAGSALQRPSWPELGPCGSSCDADRGAIGPRIRFLERPRGSTDRPRCGASGDGPVTVP
jgi:hypothetical protein